MSRSPAWRACTTAARQPFRGGGEPMTFIFRLSRTAPTPPWSRSRPSIWSSGFAALRRSRSDCLRPSSIGPHQPVGASHRPTKGVFYLLSTSSLRPLERPPSRRTPGGPSGSCNDLIGSYRLICCLRKSGQGPSWPRSSRPSTPPRRDDRYRENNHVSFQILILIECVLVGGRVEPPGHDVCSWLAAPSPNAIRAI